MSKQVKSCKSCGDKHYAKGFCKRCYMAENRSKFIIKSDRKSNKSQFDVDDFWEFVKKELKIG